MRIVFLIKFYGKTDMMPFEMLQNMFPDKSKDYVISVSRSRDSRLPFLNTSCRNISQSVVGS